jgi:hypothetical protein
MTAVDPAVNYYEANIGSVTSIEDFVDNYRPLSYALDAFGLGDQVDAKALITKVREGRAPNPKSLSMTMRLAGQRLSVVIRATSSRTTGPIEGAREAIADRLAAIGQPGVNADCEYERKRNLHRRQYDR